MTRKIRPAARRPAKTSVRRTPALFESDDHETWTDDLALFELLEKHGFVQGMHVHADPELRRRVEQLATDMAVELVDHEKRVYFGKTG